MIVNMDVLSPTAASARFVSVMAPCCDYKINE